MQNPIQNRKYANNHISIDTVVLGYDGKQLKVLLIPQNVKIGDRIESYRKLPGNIIYQDEDFEEAALRTLAELTGISKVNLYQFKTYGSKNRTDKEKDLIWLNQTLGIKVERIVTTAYLSVIRLDSYHAKLPTKLGCEWKNINEVGDLAFDHVTILHDALAYLRKLAHIDPIIFFELLPRKFTILQFRTLYDFIYQKKMDIRNFKKKLSMMEYVVPLEEFEEGVRHRAARFYRFDKVIYNKTRL
jgi:hypothetical protein